MSEAWDSFFNSNEKIFQKNKVRFNGLFVVPIDLNDNHIPDGPRLSLFL
jgi:hypothetical protein